MAGFAVVESPRDGDTNMQVDMRMLAYAAEHGVPLLRLYQWSHPTVSLGYFQRYTDYQAHECHQAPHVVRRSTGGGAIVHHHDWTYSLAMPTIGGTASDRDSAIAKIAKIGAAEPLYDLVHDVVVSWLRSHGWEASKWLGESKPAATRTACSTNCDFLCFARRSRGDVVVGEHKVMGSAQRRMPGAIIQHGSLLLSSSHFAPQLAGLAQIAPAMTANEDRPRNSAQLAVEHLLRQGPTDLLHQLIESCNLTFGGELRIVDSLDPILPEIGFNAAVFHSPDFLTRV
ncbi:MAG: hypothetical protein KDB22_14525 [Planctomycetales bacterium]|nr:hypothetical protein [Planctomycetales bacterium]